MAEAAEPKGRAPRARRATKPKAKAPVKAAVSGRLVVRQVRSGIGHAATFRRTLEALGLRHQRSVELPDNPSVRGMLYKVRHLVQVAPAGEA